MKWIETRHCLYEKILNVAISSRQLSTPPCPPLILEGESVSVHAARIHRCRCAHLFLRYYPTPPLRLEGGRGALKSRAFITILIKTILSPLIRIITIKTFFTAIYIKKRQPGKNPRLTLSYSSDACKKT